MPRLPWLTASIMGLAASVVVPVVARAQAAPLVIEVRVGGSAPLSPFSAGARVGEGAAPGLSFGVDLALSGSGRRTFYAGFGQHRFPCEKAGCDGAGRYVATGFHAGYRLNVRTQGSVIPWVKGGVITTRVESPGVPGSAHGVSAFGVGGEVGAGLYVGAFRAIAFNPGIRWAAVNSTLPGDALLRLRYVVVDLGLALAF